MNYARLSIAVALALTATSALAAKPNKDAEPAPQPLELSELRMVPATAPTVAAASEPARSLPASDADDALDVQPLPAPQSHQRSEADAPFAPLDPALTRALSLTPATWYLRPGETLREGLGRWCSAAGWQLIWRPTTDRVIPADVKFEEGTPFRQAVRETMAAFWHTDQPLIATAWLKNKVLEIKERGQ
jgi:hypothetical protein